MHSSKGDVLALGNGRKRAPKLIADSEDHLSVLSNHTTGAII